MKRYECWNHERLWEEGVVGGSTIGELCNWFVKGTSG